MQTQTLFASNTTLQGEYIGVESLDNPGAFKNIRRVGRWMSLK